MLTVIGNEALQLSLAKKHPSLNVYGLNPGFIVTNIRSLTFTNKFFSWMVESVLGLFTPTAEAYAERVLIKLMANPALEDGSMSGTAFNQKGQEILPNPWLTDDNVEKFMTESAKLLTRYNLE
jgi:hypothetical protein